MNATRACHACGRPTAELKPYCEAHTHLNRHAAKIRRELEQRERELEAVRRDGAAAVDPTGPLASDVIASLSMGARSEAQLARLIGIKRRVLVSYLVALERVGVVLRLPIGSRGRERAGACLV